MLKLLQPITSINGFKIGDKVRLKDGDGRLHIIKSFSIDGMKEFFFEVQFEDGTETMLNNITPFPSNLDKAAEEYAYTNWEDNDYHTGASEGLPFDAIGHTEKCFKAGAEWMAGQGVEAYCVKSFNPIMESPDKPLHGIEIIYEDKEQIPYILAGDKVIVQIRKK